MPYYTNDDDAVDDFSEYDPKPFTGGYDITVTYGRSIPPSDETCYPLSSRSGDAFEYQRPVFSPSVHQPSAYDEQALKTEYSSYARPDGFESGSDFARRPNSGRMEIKYGRKPESEHGSGYGERIESNYGEDGHLKHSDEKKDKKKEKKDKKKEHDYDDDEKKKKKDHHDDGDEKMKKKKDHDDEKKKKKDQYDDGDEKMKKKKDHDDDEKKKKKKDHYDDGDEKMHRKKDHDDEKKKKKDNHDDEKKKKKDKHHKGHREDDD